MRSYHEGNTGREAKETVEQISKSDTEKVGRRTHRKCFKILNLHATCPWMEAQHVQLAR